LGLNEDRIVELSAASKLGGREALDTMANVRAALDKFVDVIPAEALPDAIYLHGKHLILRNSVGNMAFRTNAQLTSPETVFNERKRLEAVFLAFLEEVLRG